MNVKIKADGVFCSFEKIYEQVKKIPKGKVATYGQIALMAGNPRWSQIVGYALHANPEPGIIPCHRIVNKQGKLAKAFAFGGENVQRDMLKREGVTFIDDNTVDLEKCRYLP
jgi:methylated-DNA-protein-cysteine methyltransferase-like protein